MSKLLINKLYGNNFFLGVYMVDKVLMQEAYNCYRFLIEHSNFKENSNGYGLTLDRTNNKVKATIAGSGFMLSALVIGAVNGWDDSELNRKRALSTIKNFYDNIPNFYGMFAHYLDYSTGKRYQKCEYSTIDTMLLVNGMLVADSYFSCPDISKYVDKIFSRIDWNKFIFKYNNRYMIRMAYNDIRGGDYLRRISKGWVFQWSMMAEQLSMYLLAAASPAVSPKRSQELFLGFERTVGGYRNYQFVYTPLGALFVHQYSHAWFDFRQYYDFVGYDWFNNSVQATLANYAYCQDRKRDFLTFAAGLWGLSSCDGPRGYSGYGAPPFTTYERINEFSERTDGTVAVYAILSSLPFCPELVKSTADTMTKNHPELSGSYGFYDSINLDANWISKDYLSIDKGISLLMIDNYYCGTNWHYYMKHRLIKNAIEKLAFIRKEEFNVDN